MTTGIGKGPFLSSLKRFPFGLATIPCYRCRRLFLPIPSLRTVASIAPSPPTAFPSSGFIEVDPAVKIEEEGLLTYAAERYYPVDIGQIFRSRYQVVCKLGYGVHSTVWLCRDLRQVLHHRGRRGAERL